MAFEFRGFSDVGVGWGDPWYHQHPSGAVGGPCSLPGMSVVPARVVGAGGRGRFTRHCTPTGLVAYHPQLQRMSGLGTELRNSEDLFPPNEM